MKKKSQFDRLLRVSEGDYPALTVIEGRRYLGDSPHHGAGWLILGIALIHLARYEEAKEAIAKAIELCPNEARQVPMAQMGYLFLQAGEYDKAKGWYRKAINLCPCDATYHIYFGALLAKQGLLKEAEKAHRVAIGCNQGCIDEAYLNLGFVLRAQERFEEAAQCFREAIRRNTEYKEAQSALRDVEQCLRWKKPG